MCRMREAAMRCCTSGAQSRCLRSVPPEVPLQHGPVRRGLLPACEAGSQAHEAYAMCSHPFFILAEFTHDETSPD